MPGLVQPADDEKETLIGYLEQQRYVLRLATFGLTDEQAAARSTVSALSVGGLVKHLTSVERFWMQVALNRVGRRASDPDASSGASSDASSGAADDYESGFRLLPGETLEKILDGYTAAAAATDAIIRSFPDLSAGVPVPPDVPWFPKDLESWSIRWIVLHLIEETARHAGHADIVREALDGASALPLMAAAEGWPATPWMQPWEPSEATQPV
jgi:Protein of unknown function (DUF664)